MTARRLVLFNLCITLLSTNLLAQKELVLLNKREISVSSERLLNGTLSYSYKSGISNKSLITLGLINLSSKYEKVKPATSSSFPGNTFFISGGIKLGIEKRIPITEIMSFFYSADILCVAELNRTHYDDPNLPLELKNIFNISVMPGIGSTLGVLFNIKNGFSVAGEISPALVYNIRTYEKVFGAATSLERESGFDFDLTNQNLKLSLIYQWEKTH